MWRVFDKLLPTLGIVQWLLTLLLASCCGRSFALKHDEFRLAYSLSL
jgi:hypothetical protein